MKTQTLLLTSLALAALCGGGTPDHLPEYTSAAAAATPAGGTVNTTEGEAVIVSLEPFAGDAHTSQSTAAGEAMANTGTYTYKGNHLKVLQHLFDDLSVKTQEALLESPEISHVCDTL